MFTGTVQNFIHVPETLHSTVIRIGNLPSFRFRIEIPHSLYFMMIEAGRIQVADIFQILIVHCDDQVKLFKIPWVNLARSEEHTSELQSRGHLVCRLLLEKKKHI